MDTNTQNLIKDLAGKHQKKPFWKSFNVLLSLWLVLNLGFFTFETITAKSLILNSSNLLLGINILASLLSWLYFSVNLNQSVNKKWDWIYLSSLIGLFGLGFGADFFAGLVGHERSLSVQASDVNCFNHIVLSTIPAAIFFSIFIKYFFLQRPYWTITFISAHIFLLATTVMELKCNDREFWHLVLGHQTTYIPIFLFLTFLYSLKQRLRSSVV